jgi:hypothetical protein
MRELVRDPRRPSPCPRCGEPVTYKGRGRRPIWCSARCRVDASIERKGNRMVGVQPEVVKIHPPAKQPSADEPDRLASGSPVRERRKRDADDWSDILLDLANQLAKGHFYNRDLAKIDTAMVRLVTVYNRRLDGLRR